MFPVRPWARSIPLRVLFALVAASCHKEVTTPPQEDDECSGARCVEEAEAFLLYKEFDKARPPLARVCEAGDGFACFRLAELHQHGRGGPVDLTQAATLYEESCAKKYGEGCERRYLLAQEGQGGPELELDFALKACEGGRPNGCMHAAEQVKAGRGVEPDLVRVAETFEKACALGDVTGCTGAGDILLDPTGPAERRARGLSAFVKACTGHSGYGCLRVGLAFHDGVGTQADLTKAKSHFTRACEFSDPDGCRIAEQLAAANGAPIVLELTTTAAELSRDGLEARGVSCNMSERGLPALGEVLSQVARHKSALDGCIKSGGEAVAVTWEFEGGEVQGARVTDKLAKKAAGCVAFVLRKAKPPGQGKCEAVLLLGDAAAAATAFTARVEKAKAKGDGRKHIRVGADDE